MPFIIPKTTVRIDVPITTTGGSSYTVYGGTTTKRKKKGRSLPVQNYTDPNNVILAKLTAGHKAIYDTINKHFKYS